VTMIKQWYAWYLDNGVPVVPSAGLMPNNECTCGDLHCSQKGAHVGNGVDFPEIGATLGDHQNIAIDVNDTSLLCLEISDIQAWNKLKERYNIPKTWACFSEGKWCVFFKSFDGMNIMWESEGVSVRVAYVLAPPSKTPDGTRIKWLVSPEHPLAEIPAKLKVQMEIVRKNYREIYWKEADEIRKVKRSALQMFVRRMYFSQEGKLSGDARREYVTGKCIAYNANTTPPMHKPLFLEIVNKEINRLETLPGIPETAVQAAAIFGGEIVDHIGN